MHSHHCWRVVLLITLDVKNVCNVWRTGKSILRFRLPLVDFERLLKGLRPTLQDLGRVRQVSQDHMGAVQGSMLGSDFLSASYSGLQRLEMPNSRVSRSMTEDGFFLALANTKVDILHTSWEDHYRIWAYLSTLIGSKMNLFGVPWIWLQLGCMRLAGW